jgi:chemotaxis protein MotB
VTYVGRVSGFLKAALFLTTTAAIGAGLFAWSVKKAARGRLDESAASLASCNKDLDACSGERDDRSKSLNEIAATLDASLAELDVLRAEHAEAEKQLASFRSLTEKFQKMIDSGKLQIVLRHGRMVVKLPAGVLFASGSAELSKEGKDALREVAGVLRQVQSRQFMVAGHTDNVPIDPKAQPPTPFKNNLELSTARALTVAQHLIASGMSPKRIVAAGYGEHEPVKDNAHEAGRQENRRIEIVLLPNVTELPLAADAGARAPADGGPADAAR